MKFSKAHKEALKKAWKLRKLRMAQETGEKGPQAKAFQVKYKVEELTPKLEFEIILEGGTAIWTTIKKDQLRNFMKRLHLAMRYGFPIESIDYGTEFYFSNSEGPTFNCLNGAKIIGYRF